jgi:hypothetical protein
MTRESKRPDSDRVENTETVVTSRSSDCYLDNRGVYHRPRKTAPPLGIVLRKFWIENRANEILEAMERYRRGKYIIPVEWVEELAEHLRTLDQSR